MSLFNSPAVINDGTADRSFSFRAQLADKQSKSVIGEWVETAASLASASKLIIKQDESSRTQRRRLLSHSYMAPITDPTVLKQITVNVTVIHHPEHSEAEIIKHVLIPLNGLKIAGVLPNFLKGFV